MRTLLTGADGCEAEKELPGKTGRAARWRYLELNQEKAESVLTGRLAEQEDSSVDLQE